MIVSALQCPYGSLMACEHMYYNLQAVHGPLSVCISPINHLNPITTDITASGTL